MPVALFSGCLIGVVRLVFVVGDGPARPPTGAEAEKEEAAPYNVVVPSAARRASGDPARWREAAVGGGAAAEEVTLGACRWIVVEVRRGVVVPGGALVGVALRWFMAALEFAVAAASANCSWRFVSELMR